MQLLFKKSGNFFIKFFDTFTEASLQMIYLIALLYEEVYFVKPNTSRYANSEKYIFHNRNLNYTIHLR